jgi:hypothetical protein
MDITHLATLVLRQEQPSEPVGTAAATGAAETGCEANNNYDGRMGIRISAIFVIFVGSTMGLLDYSIKSTSNATNTYKQAPSSPCSLGKERKTDGLSIASFSPSTSDRESLLRQHLFT